MTRTKPREKAFVALEDSETNIKIVGELTMDDEECIVEGVVEGISAFDAFVRPEQLQGKSSRHQSVWIDQLVNFSPTLPGDESIPATVRLISTSVYYGEFDPRSKAIDRLACSLQHIHCLTDDLPVERKVSAGDRRLTATASIDVHRCDLLVEKSMRVGIDYLPSVGEHVTYEQVLVVEFERSTSLAHATGVMNRALTLLSLIAGATVETPERTISSGSDYATEWKARARMEDVSNPTQWLEWPDKCVKLLSKLLPAWSGIDDDELLLARMFLGAAHESVYIENRFLGYCQVFEHLNTRRAPRPCIDEARYATAVLEPLRPTIAALEVNTRTKKKIVRAISDANRPSLEERLAHAFSEKPNWLQQLDGEADKIRASVCRRRNELSHGSPQGAVRDQRSAIDTQIDRHFVYLHCLSELFYRCGIGVKEIDKLVMASKDVSTLLWLARKRAERS